MPNQLEVPRKAKPHDFDEQKLTTPLAHYAACRWVGDLLFIAGQGCRDPETGIERGLLEDGGYDITLQTYGVFDNLERVLKNCGLDRSHLVDITVFLTDMGDFSAMNAVWNEFFKDLNCPPCRTTVAVLSLPGKNRVEMKAMAAQPNRNS